MAQAGFVWTPLLPGDDLATCLYCNISLSGWEEGDDPMSVNWAFPNDLTLTFLREEHRKRGKSGTSCPFLVYSSASGTSSTTATTPVSPTTNKLTRSTSAKPPSKTPAKPPSRSRSSRLTRGRKELAKENDVSEEEDSHIPEEAEDDMSGIVPTVKLVTKPAEAKKTRKSSRAPSARPSTRGVTRSASQPVPEIQHTKGKSKGKRALMDVVEEGESSDELAIRVSEEEEVEEERPVPSRSRASRKPSKTKGRTTLRKKQEEVEVQDESEDFGASKRKTRKARVIEDTDEHEDAPPVGVNASAREEVEIDPVRSQPRTSKRGRHAVTTAPPPPASPAMSVNPLAEGGDIVSTYRSPSNIKAKTIPQSTKDEPPTGRAIEAPSLPPASPTVAVNPTPAEGDEAISTHRSPSNIKAKSIPQSTKDEPPTGRAIKTPSLTPAPPTMAVHPTPAEGDEVMSTYHYQSNIEEKTMTQSTEYQSPTGNVVKTPSPSPAPPTAAVSPTTAKADKVVSIYSDHYLSSNEAETMTQSTGYESPTRNAVKTPPAPPTAAVNPSPATAKKVLSTYSDHYLSSNEAETMPQLTQDEPPTGNAVKTPSPPPAPPTKATMPEPQILPALSRIPYLPLQAVTNAELDMTVEEWIRYQMEIEYDKLKRDGERELARFKARAEEARKIIESL
jgi:hypothetical protein